MVEAFLARPGIDRFAGLKINVVREQNNGTVRFIDPTNGVTMTPIIEEMPNVHPSCATG